MIRKILFKLLGRYVDEYIEQHAEDKFYTNRELVKSLIEDIKIFRDDIKELREKTCDLDLLIEPRSNSRMEFILGAISAFEKKLGKVEWHFEKDPHYLPPPPILRRVWSVNGKKRKKK